MKRGASGKSLIVAVDKPSGMTSHDVVNRARHIFSEKRIGHMGTLDPLASGVLVLGVGPAARLDRYMTAHDKVYEVTIAFGDATDTDDCEGTVIHSAPVSEEVLDPLCAASFLESLKGSHRQMPPIYSAVKVNGRKACDEARKGNVIALEPRDIEIYDARLVSVDGIDGSIAPAWTAVFSVSKGTYIRALARDIGTAMGTYAHVESLRRLTSGPIDITDCISLDALEEAGEDAALDPLPLLGMRFFFAEGDTGRRLSNGNILDASTVSLCCYAGGAARRSLCACTSGVCDSPAPPKDGECIAAVVDGRLKAVCVYDGANHAYRPQCLFSEGVMRGGAIAV